MPLSWFSNSGSMLKGATRLCQPWSRWRTPSQQFAVSLNCSIWVHKLLRVQWTNLCLDNCHLCIRVFSTLFHICFQTPCSLLSLLHSPVLSQHLTVLSANTYHTTKPRFLLCCTSAILVSILIIKFTVSAVGFIDKILLLKIDTQHLWTRRERRKCYKLYKSCLLPKGNTPCRSVHILWIHYSR